MRTPELWRTKEFDADGLGGMRSKRTAISSQLLAISNELSATKPIVHAAGKGFPAHLNTVRDELLRLALPCFGLR